MISASARVSKLISPVFSDTKKSSRRRREFFEKLCSDLNSMKKIKIRDVLEHQYERMDRLIHDIEYDKVFEFPSILGEVTFSGCNMIANVIISSREIFGSTWLSMRKIRVLEYNDLIVSHFEAEFRLRDIRANLHKLHNRIRDEFGTERVSNAMQGFYLPIRDKVNVESRETGIDIVMKFDRPTKMIKFPRNVN